MNKHDVRLAAMSVPANNERRRVQEAEDVDTTSLRNCGTNQSEALRRYSSGRLSILDTQHLAPRRKA